MAGGSSDCPQGSVSDDAHNNRPGFPLAQDDFSSLLANDFSRSNRATRGSGRSRLADPSLFSDISEDLPVSDASVAAGNAQFQDLPRLECAKRNPAAQNGVDEARERAFAFSLRPAGEPLASPRLESADMRRWGRKSNAKVQNAIRIPGVQRVKHA